MVLATPKTIGISMSDNIVNNFIEAAKRIGAEVSQVPELDGAIKYIKETTTGIFLVPDTPLIRQHRLVEQLKEAGVDVYSGNFREAGQVVDGGVTFCNFCMADSGTVVLDSTDEDVRLATTLPEKHFVIVDPTTILKDNLAAVGPMNTLHTGNKPIFVAYITGPSRTADIERVLTIGCHGPRELHIILVDNISDDLLEN